MRYTRYDLKKKKKKNNNKIFFAIFAIMVISAVVLGTAISKFTIKGPSNSTSSEKVNSKPVKFIAIQGGMYAKTENADKEKAVLALYGNPFIIIDGNLNRVFSGIYLEDTFQNIIDALNKNDKSNSKMIFTLNKKDLCDAEIAEIVSANIKILSKLTESEVRAVQTQEFKAWTSSLKKVDGSSKNIKVLNDLEDYVGKLPAELTKDKAADNYIFLYNILKNICTISK